MDDIVKQSIEELIAERDTLIAELKSMKHTMFFENSVSKSIYDRMKAAYAAATNEVHKLNCAVDVQAERIAELTRQLADLRKAIYTEEED